MKRRKMIIIAGVIVAVAALLGGVLFAEREPGYGGRRLSEWLEICERVRGKRMLTDPCWEDTRQALLNIGTNAIPELLKRVGYERPAWHSNLVVLCRNWPHVPGTEAYIRWATEKRGAGYSEAGVCAFEVLGPIGLPAVPALEQWASDPSHWLRASRSYRALRAIGPVGGPAMRRAGLRCLCRAGVGRDSVDLPSLLLITTNDPDASVRREARVALERIAPELLTNGVSGP